MNIGNNIAGFFLLILECKPVDYWNYWITSTCLADYTDAIFVLGIVNIFTDLLVWYVQPWVADINRAQGSSTNHTDP